MKQYIRIGTETLAYLEEGKGEDLLLLHGNLSSSVHMQPLMERLKEDFRCVAPDMRGFGDSSYHHRFDSLDELAEDISRFMEKREILSAYVVGWSAGAGVAMKLAAAHPDKVRKLFCIAGVGFRGLPILEKGEEGGKAYADKERMAAESGPIARLLKMIEEKDAAAMSEYWNRAVYTVSKPSAEQNDLWIKETLKQRNLVDLEWAMASLNMSEEAGPYGPGDGSIRNISCPVVFTAGDRDGIVPPAMVQSNQEAVGASAGRIVYERCGHSPLVDCPDRLAADIRFFFGC